MLPSPRSGKSALRAFLLLFVFAAALLPASAMAAKSGELTQLSGKKGCLVDESKAKSAKTCGSARALLGPGPFMGSRAIAISPDGRNVYVASSKSNAIAVFGRNPKTGVLTQPAGKAGCIAVKGEGGCAAAVGLEGPNSVAVSADGRTVYATSRTGNSLTSFRRNPKAGGLRQLPPELAGCISSLPIPGCTAGRALLAPDVVALSPDGNNVYVGSFFGNAVAVFSRNSANGALSQPTGSGGCIAESTVEGCAPGIGLGAVEGLAVSNEGTYVYAASALSNGLAVLTRDPATGALSQALNGSGCIVNAALSGCTTGVQLEGANAVAVSPRGGYVYATSLFSNSVTSFEPSTTSAGLLQKAGTAGCLVYLRAVGCSFGRAMIAPEGLAISPGGTSVYVAAFRTGAIDVLVRNPKTGAVAQMPGAGGCQAPKSLPGCTVARALGGVSSIAVSPDGRFVYSTAFGSNAVDVFRRTK